MIDGINSDRSLSIVFLASGFSALLYQIVWQRSLFAIYGINIEAVTVVVTAFMVGLGVGSLVGGAVSKDPRRPALALFGAVELAIGAFGVGSLRLFRWVGGRTLELSFGATALVTFLVVLVPTLLMGSTLPLLTAHLVRRTGNVGRSLGRLYCVNTLGSALAALAAVLALMRALGQHGVVMLAATTNFVVGATALLLASAERRRAP
ncbi:MAG TPA: fused MFS/spermidine synthase [Polyangia bacterium]|jgi:spermidine synthase|nr:fused MFS/spermidine synthase [Polyangia bacterium]